MRLVTFQDKDSQQHIGAYAPDGRIVALPEAHQLYSRERGKSSAAALPNDMRQLFEGGDAVLDAARAALEFVVAQRPSDAATLFYRAEDIRLKAPIIPKKFFHTAGNFREHHHEAEKAGFSHPVLPWIVFFQNVDAIIGPDEPVIFPPHLTAGTGLRTGAGGGAEEGGQAFRREAGRAYIGGFVIFNDITARDIQRTEMKSGVFSFCKAIDSFCPLGPHIVTADEIRDPHNLAMELRVNGEPRQRSHSSKMSVTIPEILAHYSAMGYSAGDVVSTGTVSGVAAFSADPQAWYLKPGDVMECEIEQIGVLRNPVISWEQAYGKRSPSAG